MGRNESSSAVKRTDCPLRLTMSRSSASPTSLAAIFQLEVTKWNDPLIAADNPDVELPDTTIVVARQENWHLWVALPVAVGFALVAYGMIWLSVPKAGEVVEEFR